MNTDEKMKPVNELFEQTMKNYEQALKTGLKLQEESTKCWTGLMTQVTTPQDLQKKIKTMADDLIPQTQKSIEDCIKLIEQNSRTNLELLKKAVSAAQATTLQEAQQRFLGFWEASLNAMRDTAQSVTQTNNKAIEGWMEFIRKGGEPAAAGAKS